MRKLTEIYKKYKKEVLTKEELRFLYEIDSKIEGFGYENDPRIDEILHDRDIKGDLSYILRCNKNQIGMSRQDFDKNPNLVYYYGNLDLSDLTSLKGVTFPQIINGTLWLDNITNLEGIILPLTFKKIYLANWGEVTPQNVNEFIGKSK